MKEITLGQNGLPPKKKNYSSEEKAIIVAKAAEVGTRTVADAYDIDWHSIASWKKYNAKQVILSPAKKTINIINKWHTQRISNRISNRRAYVDAN